MMTDHHPIIDWQTVALNAVSILWGAKYTSWIAPMLPSADHALEWIVALLVGVSVIVLNVLKAKQVWAEIREKRKKKKQ